MNRRTLVVLVGAFALFVVAVVGAMAFTGNSDPGSNIHTMPDGSMMSDSMMTGGMHTMPDGSMMSDMGMP